MRPCFDVKRGARPCSSYSPAVDAVRDDCCEIGCNRNRAFAAGYLNPDEAPGDEGFDLIVAQDSGG